MQKLAEPLLPQSAANSAEDAEKSSLRRTAVLLWKTARPRSMLEHLLAGAVIVLLAASKFLNLALPLVMSAIVDTLSNDGSFATCSALIGTYCGLTIAADGCVQAQSACWGRISCNITQRMSLALFEHLHALSLRWHLNRRTGELLSVMNTGVGALSTLLQVVIFQISAAVLELLLTSAVFLRIGVPAISLCVIGGAVLYTVYTIVLTKKRTQQRREVNEATKKAQDAVVDSLLNFETVKLFACEHTEAHRYDGLAQELARMQQRAQDSLSLLNWGQTGAMQLGMAGGLLVACASTSAQQMSVGDFVMVQLYIAQLFQPLANLGGNYRRLTQALADVEKMQQLFDTPIEVVDKLDAADLREVMRSCPVPQRDVVFEHVSFRYAVGGAGLSALSLRVPPGGSVALVGPSGSGKSTSTRLLCRLLEVHRGAVRICGHDIRDVTQHSLRSVISTVSQDTVLFNASVRSNLAYGSRHASDEQLRAACKVARVDEYVGRLEHGLDTTVGERGLRLSGGEKQRLGIARALLREPAILVLDEATSALDTETERQVQEALEAASRGRCTLSIAHRLSTIVLSNEIIVLKAGIAVERGTHAALLRKANGLYASMWARQSDKAVAKAASGLGELSWHECKCCVDDACCCAPHHERHTGSSSAGAHTTANTTDTADADSDATAPNVDAPATHAWASLEGVVSRVALPAASRRLSRAYTLHAALIRLGLLAPEPPLWVTSRLSSLFGRRSPSDSGGGGVLRLHLLGADDREGCTLVETARIFAPLCGLLAGSRWKELEVLLCGPNCRGPRGCTQRVREPVDGGAAALSIRYEGSLYHELDEAELGEGPPTLAVAFQGGLWGYDSWAPTIARVLEFGCPLLVTSYNIAEAEDDEESLQALAVQAAWRWAPEHNPWRSLEDEREHRQGNTHSTTSQPPRGATSSESMLHENGAWQCLG